MNQDPRNIIAHARAMMIEQIIHCCGGTRLYRIQLENMTDTQLREEWNKAIGEPLEEVGI